MKLSDWPSRGDYVVIKIKRIMPYGAVADLEEYAGKDGFIHISNIANRRIKNIRSHVSEGNIRVGSIFNIDKAKESIEISLRRVSSADEKRKLEDWKREKRADKLFEIVCKGLKMPHKKTYTSLVPQLEQEFGDLLSAFENASTSGEEAFKDLKLPADFVKSFVKYSKENIVPAEAVVKGNLILTSNKGNGIVQIKEVLKNIEKPDIKVEYVSAPKYRVRATGPDYASAEKLLNSTVQNAIDMMKKLGGEASFERTKG